MSFSLFIGDIFEELSDIAKSHDPSSTLLTEKLVKDNTNLEGTYYTSLPDIGDLELFNRLCLSSEEIFYHPPKKWSDDKIRYWTEIILWNANQYKLVHGLPLTPFEKLLIESAQPIQRRSDTKSQLWTVGCSITAGIGVKNQESWPFLVAQNLAIPYSNLAKGSSNIIWASNQICQSPIKPGDLVFWGLTGHPRISYIDEDSNRLLFINSHSSFENLKYDKKLFIEILDSATLLYHNVMAIRNVYNFCTRLGARLVILGLMHDWDSVYKTYQIKNFKQYQCWPEKYIDLGNDNLHPGPKEHQRMASEFLKFYRYLYPKESIE